MHKRPRFRVDAYSPNPAEEDRVGAMCNYLDNLAIDVSESAVQHQFRGVHLTGLDPKALIEELRLSDSRTETRDVKRIGAEHVDTETAGVHDRLRKRGVRAQ
jgi:hypothetical protein